MEHAREIAVALLIPLAVLAAVDGLWIHLCDPSAPIPGWQSQLVFQGLLSGAVAVAALHVVLALRVARVDTERFAS